MSFILDALRKSEAARRRSETPDLFASMPAAREPIQTRPSWPLWLLGTVAAISLIAVLWLVAQRTQVPTKAPETPQASSDADATTESTPTDSIAATSITAPAPEPMPPQSAPQSPLHTPPPPAREPLDATTATVMPPPALPLPSMRDLQVPPPDTTVVASAPALPATGSIASLADLDPATRKLLPPLKLSMHLWNETPAQRFVILDGQRLREGDVLGDLVVERITRDGAVLVWRNGQLKIELR